MTRIEKAHHQSQIGLNVSVCDTVTKREDRDREQTKGLTRAAGQRGGAQAEAENDKEFKGRKRLRGRKGRTAKGKRPKGAGPPGRAEGSTGIGVAGGGDGTNSGQKNKTKRKTVTTFEGHCMKMSGRQM